MEEEEEEGGEEGEGGEEELKSKGTGVSLLKALHLRPSRGGVT